MQPDLFAAPGSTAIYPNRLRDKAQVEAARGWPEQGSPRTQFLLPSGEVFAVGYRRIVYGDHGGATPQVRPGFLYVAPMELLATS